MLKKVQSKNIHKQEAVFYIRENSNDQQIIDEIRIKNQYLSRGMGVFDKGDIVIDIGAHIGVFSIECAIRGAVVYAFEPDPENYEILVRNIDANNFRHIITPVRKAVSNTNGIYSLYLDRLNYGSHSLIKKYVDHLSGDKVDVEVLSIDVILDMFEKVKLVKLDCEGAEYRILKGADLGKVERITMELHDRKKSSELAKYLMANKFFINWYFGKRLGKLRAKKW